MIEAFHCSTPAEFERLARHLREQPREPATKLAVLASFLASFIAPYLVVASHRSGVPVEPWFGPFNQFEQLVLDDASDLWRYEPDVIWLAARLEDVEPDLLAQLFEIGPEAGQQRLEALVRRMVGLARQIRRHSRATLFVSNFCLPQVNAAYVLDASDPSGMKYLITEAKDRKSTRLNSSHSQIS